MKKQLISWGEYNYYLEKTRWADDNETTVDDLIDIYEYLKDKSVKEYSFDDEPNIIKYAHIKFLSIALGRSHVFAYYNPGTEGFLKSDYISKEIKREIKKILKHNCSLRLMDLLKSEKDIKDFSKKELKEIDDAFCDNFDKLSERKKKEKCSEVWDIFNNYIFLLDGEESINYIKEKYGDELPIIMLENSGVPSYPSYYSGYGVNSKYLGEQHLLSLYKKFDKFYPDKKKEFVRMVEWIKRLTPTEFVINYLEFVRNGLDSNFNNKEGNISVDGLHGNTRDFVGLLSISKALGNDDADEIDAHYLIRRRFFKMIEEYEKNKELKQLQTKEKNKTKVLNK